MLILGILLGLFMGAIGTLIGVSYVLCSDPKALYEYYLFITKLHDL